MTLPETLLGIDFSSSPSRQKPITVAKAHWGDGVVQLDDLLKLPTLNDFDNLLRQGQFVAAIDMPFGLPRELVDGLGWPGAQRYDDSTWGDLIRFYCKLDKSDIRNAFKAWCDSKPPGKKFAHRTSDKPAGSSPSMKWVNPPVAFMLHAGAIRLLESGVTLPGLHMGDPQRLAFETYPGFLARQIVGRQSYKSDDAKKNTPDRQNARSEILCAMEEGMLLGIRCQMPTYLRADMLLDPKGDLLDAALCVLSAAWCAKRPDSYFGMPPKLDPVEGWIVPVPWK